MKHILFSFAMVLTISAGFAQNTVGLLSYDPMKSFDGYNLIYPHRQPNVYLINNCGEIVHTWEDSAQFVPGNTAYLLDNGDLVKTKRTVSSTTDRIWAGGGGATVEIRSWDNDLKWSYTLNDSTRRLHHDIAVTHDGNILMLAWELKNVDECQMAGRDTSNLDDREMWPDMIIEVDPDTDSIVWEWHVWDHLIQDHDNSVDNFGVVAVNPNLVDVNFPLDRRHPDWMHSNSMDYLYQPMPMMDIDMIMLSVPYFNEIWIIDHSTTTAQAASHSGGNSGLGGDLMFRWGNPEAYRSGDSTDQQLFFQHDAHWVDNYLPTSFPDYGKIAVFNNRAGEDFSTANILEPDFNNYYYEFLMQGNTWLPEIFDKTYMHPEPTKLFSTGLSSIQRLANGNTLICSGRFGYSFELTPSNEIVWEYKTPLQAGSPVDQGTMLSANANLTFRMTRIPSDNVAFDGRDLSPKGFIETNPNINFCDSLSSTMDRFVNYDLNVFPNPASDQLVIEWNRPEEVNITVYNALGQMKTSYRSAGGRMYVNTSGWESGYHFILINGQASKVVVIE